MVRRRKKQVFLWLSAWMGHFLTLSYSFSDQITTHNFARLILTSQSLPVEKQTKLGGGIYYFVKYDVVLIFGLTELKAQVAWRDKSVCYYCLSKPLVP